MANITQTTLSTAINQTATMLNLASVANIVAPSNNQPPQKIYVIDPDQTRGELMLVVGAPVGTQVPVARIDQFKSSHTVGSTVVIAPFDASLGGGFSEYDPTGNPSVAGSYPGVPIITPWLNVNNGNQWLPGILGQWVPGWNSPNSIKGVTAAVASAAGAILPSGPLFHVTGTAAVTGFTIPVGFAGGSFTIIPDAIFTWTTAGNIGLAGTAVVGRSITFTWDSNAGKFWPSYV